MSDLFDIFAQLTLPNSFPRVTLTPTTLQQVLSSVFIVIGGIAALFMLIGAVRYVTSNAEQNKITEAKNTILYAGIGMVVAMSAFAIVQFISSSI